MQIYLRANLLEPTGFPELDACVRKFFPAPGPLFERILHVCQRQSTRVVFLRDIRWMAAEIKEAPAFLLTGGKTVAQPGHFYSQQLAAAASLPTTSRWKTIRMYRQAFLNVGLAPGTFRFLDQWTQELLTSTDVALAWPSPFAGARLRPVWDGAGARRDDAIHVQVQNVLVPVEWDETVLETWDDGPDAPSTPRRRGTLCYPAEALQNWDLARTAEPFGCQGTGEILVSSRFHSWYSEQPWNGLRFWPVWALGSAHHRQHGESWRQILSALRDVPQARLWC